MPQRVYKAVTAVGSLNFSGARIQLPSTLHIKEWEALIESSANVLTVDYLKYDFPAEYERPVPTPATGNHTSMLRHQRDVAIYIMAEVREGAMLGPFDALPFTPWCQVNALLTWPKDSQLRRVIIDLSWPHPELSVLTDTHQKTHT